VVLEGQKEAKRELEQAREEGGWRTEAAVQEGCPKQALRTQSRRAAPSFDVSQCAAMAWGDQGPL